uniref:Uncharacterized protein n=1 Tax=Rhizophora mucronata TaxID=61149 RepID=A0A2P2NEB2_RHIMU
MFQCLFFRHSFPCQCYIAFLCFLFETNGLLSMSDCIFLLCCFLLFFPTSDRLSVYLILGVEYWGFFQY